MALRYTVRLGQCPEQPCPNPGRFRSDTRKAFRILNRPATEGDFVPPAVKPPRQARPDDKCEMFALSFFESLAKAREHWARLNERVDAAARYGNAIGELDLVPTDGVMCDPDAKKRHFDMHQESDVLFAARIVAFHAP